MFDPVSFRITNLAEHGDTVLRAGGRGDRERDHGVPVMGTFEVRDGRIVQWRDYFDMGLTGKLLSGKDVATLLPH
jgi:limonene-1,2-epoxide hydrolase